ncbi:heterocyst frequency control protein PatD [Oxynema aestuarii]|uniref:Heterocyst frequency control protein PatD n=1 Tax=Oxynema aestuarii AP17 TaxID=2064643 RepID=A0A6H1TTG8_9CYAN|nr:heterocyst frequency control protein PatD [Oxynema aestuarii]QIZ69882.1 heterocyst frequency control protein PatD [Oxynema aestuarii AP17]
MLPEVHCQKYRQFQQVVEELLALASETEGDSKTLKVKVLEMQQLFQEQILGLGIDDLDPSVASCVQSYQTEMHKQQRLLGNEVLFLQTCQQPQTRARRLAQIRERLEALSRYLVVVLGEASQEDARRSPPGH